MQRSTRSRPTSSHYLNCIRTLGLIARKDTSASIHTNKKTKHYFARILPSHITAAFQKWVFNKEKMAFPLDYDPKFSQCWSEHPRDKVFKANTIAFSTQFSGFSIYHPIYHENTVLLATRHASTLLLSAQRKQPHSCSSLPGIKRWPRTHKHHSAANTHLCKFLGTIP